MKDTFQVMQTSQDKLQGVLDKQFLELKAITEKTSMIQVPLVKATVRQSSTQSISRKEILAKYRINTVLIPPGSIRFPDSMIDVQIQIRQPVEVNLAEFPVDQLQMIQQQLAAELRDRELVTYKQNTQLKQKNAEITAGLQTKAHEIRTYERKRIGSHPDPTEHRIGVTPV